LFRCDIETAIYILEGEAATHTAADDQAGIELLPHLDDIIKWRATTGRRARDAGAPSAERCC